MGEGFRRNQAKAYKQRECAAYTARLATANLLSNAKSLVEIIEVVCDLMDSATVPPVGTEVIIRARQSSVADVMVCNRRVATLNLTSAELRQLFSPDKGMVIGVVTEHSEITPCITVAVQEPSEDR